MRKLPSRYFLRTLFVNEGQWLNTGKGNSLRITVDTIRFRQFVRHCIDKPPAVEK